MLWLCQKNASELYYWGIRLDGSIQTKTQSQQDRVSSHWHEIAEGEVY